MIATSVRVHTSESPEMEVELTSDGDGWLAFKAGDTAVVFSGTADQLLACFNGASDLLIDVQSKRDAERVAARAEMLFDAFGGLDPCEHPSITGARCDACGAEVPF